MAQVEGETYKQIDDWECPKCSAYRTYIRIGITLSSFWKPYIHCTSCNSYFTVDGKEIPEDVIYNRFYFNGV